MPSNRVSRRMRDGGVLLSIGLSACTLLCGNPARGQSASEWLTSSGDAARDAWQRAESKITPHNAGKLQLLWKVKLAAKPMGMLSFREPLIVSGVKTADGVHTLAIFAAAANQVFALDTDTGKVVWQSDLKWESNNRAPPMLGCRGYYSIGRLFHLFVHRRSPRFMGVQSVLITGKWDPATRLRQRFRPTTPPPANRCPTFIPVSDWQDCEAALSAADRCG